MNTSLQAAGGHWWAGGGGTCGGQTRHVSSPHGAWDCPALPERACQAPPRSARGRKQGCRVPVLQMRKHRACRSDSLSVVAQLRTGVSSTQPQVCFLRRGLRVSVQRDAGEQPRTPGPESGAWAFPSVSGLLGLLTVSPLPRRCRREGGVCAEREQRPGVFVCRKRSFLVFCFLQKRDIGKEQHPLRAGRRYTRRLFR